MDKTGGVTLSGQESGTDPPHLADSPQLSRPVSSAPSPPHSFSSMSRIALRTLNIDSRKNRGPRFRLHNGLTAYNYHSSGILNAPPRDNRPATFLSFDPICCRRMRQSFPTDPARLSSRMTRSASKIAGRFARPASTTCTDDMFSQRE